MATPMSRADVEAVLTRITEGETLSAILPHGGARAPFYAALADPGLEAEYRRAREARADRLVDEIVAIADGDTDPRDRQVRIEARKWTASKLRPREYGDRLEVHQTGQIDLRAALALADARVASLTPGRHLESSTLGAQPLLEPVRHPGDLVPTTTEPADPTGGPGEEPGPGAA